MCFEGISILIPMNQCIGYHLRIGAEREVTLSFFSRYGLIYLVFNMTTTSLVVKIIYYCLHIIRIQVFTII